VGEVLAGELSLTALQTLDAQGLLRRVEMMNPHHPLLDVALPCAGLPFPSDIPELLHIDGRGVLVAIIDSGFDLTHPCFRDSNGRLRVEALLDQTTGPSQSDWKTWSGANLETAAALPLSGDPVHGTHVASIAAGSPFPSFGGVAQAARFLLVQTDFLHFTDAMNWVRAEAAKRGMSCVVNYSAGHHKGAHDGTHIEELEGLAGFSEPGIIFVAAAGNSGDKPIHTHAVLEPGATREVFFGTSEHNLIISGWYSQADEFDVAIFPPSAHGQVIRCSAGGSRTQFVPVPGGELTLTRTPNDVNQSVEILVDLRFVLTSTEAQRNGWKLQFTGGKHLPLGVLDFWIASPGGEFSGDPSLIEPSGTLTMPATSPVSIAVASFASKESWNSDEGLQSGPAWHRGISAFSSRGPTRSKLSKPDVAAPGEWLTAAGAASWQASIPPGRVLSSQRLATLRGTSMAAPVVTGVIALMLQVNKNLTAERARRILTETAVKGHCTCTTGWCKACGFGLVNAIQAVRTT
jgi:subtilisin family serine protease